MIIKQTLKTMTIYNKKKYVTDTVEGTSTNQHEPIIFDLASIAGLFFKEDAVNALLEENSITIKNLYSKNSELASIYIDLSLANCDYYELTFRIMDLRGDESIRIYDELINLDSYNLKKWMHIALCDEIRKRDLINNFPENYSFKPYLGMSVLL